MEGIITNKITPLIKCMVLFLIIFTTKVLTSRSQESQEVKNGIHHVKPSHYVRTFTKYHHRRTIQWNNNNDQDINNYWPVTNEQHKSISKRSISNLNFVDSNELYKVYKKDRMVERESIPETNLQQYEQKYWHSLGSRIKKRSVDIPNSNEFVGSSNGGLPNFDQLTSNTVKENIVNSLQKTAISPGKVNNNAKNGVPDHIKAYKVKAAVIPTPATTTMGPTISCLYKIHDSVALSVTPSYADDKNAQLMVEIDNFETGPTSETTLPNGEESQVEQCTDSRASCFTLWHQDNEGNITVLGQGCWRDSTEKSSCDKCTRVTAKLPGTRFCCCTKNYCNADFLSLKEEPVTIKAESTMDTTSRSQNATTSNTVMAAILALVAILVVALLLRQRYCNKMQIDKEDDSDELDVEKGDVMGTGPDALATGLTCVDNLTLIEHIGRGKFGSVWRGSLGTTPVAVKLYSNTHTWQREASIYALPHLAHPNILKYYGSDNRQPLANDRGSQLIVVELCASSLRSRLQIATLSWQEFAHLAHGLAAALAHLHTPSGNKPCVVHRDVNSSNVLVTASGDARLADLGLAQLLHSKRDRAQPTRITEAGTLRYLAPEALEGALDLSGALAALCAVDVFALALVLWEMLWRTRGAHVGPVPSYAPPYQHAGLPPRPTLAQMQSLVSRNKARPPLPKGPVQQSRALKIAVDTCDECWDHDAEARLTAVCVEERMSELNRRLHCQGPLIHDNIHPHTHPPAESNMPSPQESDKNSNCTSTQTCDVHTPLLYPQPHMGRNACIERNTHTNTQQTTVELIHKSLKDITAPVETNRVRNNDENCLSVARISHTRVPVQENSGFSEIRSYQRPLEYVQNDVTSHEDRGPKQTNLLHDVKVEKPKWGIKKFFDKLNKSKLETEVKLTENSQRPLTSIVDKPVNNDRPSNLNVNPGPYNFEAPCTLSPPNKTLSPTMMMESDKVFGFKEIPSRDDVKTPNQIFAVIVPKAKPPDLMEMKTKHGSSDSLNKRSVKTSTSAQSIPKSNSESDDSTVKKRLSCENQVVDSGSSKASINLELQYIDTPETYNGNVSPFEINSDCSSSEDEHLMLLSENGGAKITIQTISKPETDKKKYQNDVLKESSQVTDFTFNKFQNKYTNLDNEFSDPNDKENLVNGYSGDNPVYLAALNGEIDTNELKYNLNDSRSPKPNLKNLAIKRQHSLEHVSDIFSSSGEVNLLNPAGRVKTPGDLPVAVRRARRDRALQKGRASECNRLSLYDDRMMFGNSL